MAEHPYYEEMDYRINYRFRGTEATLIFKYRNLEQIGGELYVFNLILSSCWEQPETIPEVREDTQKWKIFNEYKEQSR